MPGGRFPRVCDLAEAALRGPHGAQQMGGDAPRRAEEHVLDGSQSTFWVAQKLLVPSSNARSY